MALGPALLLDIALNPRVQDVAGKLFGSVYSRIFKDGHVDQQVIELKALSPDEQPLLQRLMVIETRISLLPTNDEMAMAFASLQAELRQGQQRLLAAVVALGALNTILLSILCLR